MSQETVELARQVFDAFNRRDLGAYLALMDADVEAGSLLVALEGDYRGHAGIRRWWENLHEFVPDYTAEVVEVRDLGDLTLVTVLTRGHGADSYTPFETPLWWIGRWRAGQCVWWRSCGTEAEALEAVGLSGEAMSLGNVEAIKRVYAAFNRRDPGEAVELVSPDFTFKSEFDALFGRRYEGRSGFRQYFRDMADVWAAFHIELEEFESLGDVVIVAYRECAVGRSSGVEVEARGYEVWHFDHGCPISNDNYPTREQALEAVGLSE